MNVDSPTALLYHTYNSLFLSLPFQGIQETGTHLALFAQACQNGLREGLTPEEIIRQFGDDYYEKSSPEERLDILFNFIKYIERQVVLFDAVEDARFEQRHRSDTARPLVRLLGRLENDDDLREKLLKKLGSFSLRLVLTAHPTQFYPGKVLGILNDLGTAIQGHDLEQIRLYLMQLGKTAFYNRERPTPYSEAVSLGWYLENVFYHALPDILFRLLKALRQDVTQFDNPQLLSLGFWPGGDRDGNPYVDSDVTLLVAQRLRESVLRGYYRDIRQLKRRLTFRGVEELIGRMEDCLKNTLYPTESSTERYAGANDLLSDLYRTRSILLSDHEGLFLDELDLFILKVRVFGFYFASLDIRQNSARIAEVWQDILSQHGERQADFTDPALDEPVRIDRLLSRHFDLNPERFSTPFTRETLRSFQAVSTIQQNNGPLGCHRYIISNCASAFDVASVLALASGVNPYEQAPPLDIVPLFETLEDLEAAPAIL
ncbi:MAG TPA: phosphoenolpyruvate carboxylase, partial [Saprospiraceae bacterium]|nr:phosphoenolpyruvate carboxylase [Saprospiraceae bacterium]